MASIYELKTRFQDILRPLVRMLAKAGVTANGVTLFALALSVATGLWLALAPESSAPYFAYPVLLFVRMALNAIDGMLAREFDQKTRLGAFLNELGDVLSDAALYLALGFISGAEIWLAAIFAIMAIATEVTSLIGTGIGVPRRNDGPMGKSDRAFVIGSFMLFGGIWPSLLEWTNSLLILLAILCLVTIGNRIHRSLGE